VLGAIGTPAAHSAGLGGGGALHELTESQPETTTTATTSKSASTSSGEPTNSQKTIFLALGAAVLLLGAIAIVIARDARRVAPAGDPDAIERESSRGSAAQLRRRRAKARAARQQRKRNR
jgi:hypothetical protein